MAVQQADDRHCAMRMVQTCAASMVHRAQAEDCGARPVPSTPACCARQQPPSSMTLPPAGSGALAGAAGRATESQGCTAATAGLVESW